MLWISWTTRNPNLGSPDFDAFLNQVCFSIQDECSKCGPLYFTLRFHSGIARPHPSLLKRWTWNLAPPPEDNLHKPLFCWSRHYWHLHTYYTNTYCSQIFKIFNRYIAYFFYYIDILIILIFTYIYLYLCILILVFTYFNTSATVFRALCLLYIKKVSGSHNWAPNLPRDTSFSAYLLLYFLFIFYLIFLLYLPRLPCHFDFVVIEQQFRKPLSPPTSTSERFMSSFSYISFYFLPSETK